MGRRMRRRRCQAHATPAAPRCTLVSRRRERHTRVAGAHHAPVPTTCETHATRGGRWGARALSGRPYRQPRSEKAPTTAGRCRPDPHGGTVHDETSSACARDDRGTRRMQLPGRHVEPVGPDPREPVGSDPRKSERPREHAAERVAVGFLISALARHRTTPGRLARGRSCASGNDRRGDGGGRSSGPHRPPSHSTPHRPPPDRAVPSRSRTALWHPQGLRRPSRWPVSSGGIAAACRRRPPHYTDMTPA